MYFLNIVLITTSHFHLTETTVPYKGFFNLLWKAGGQTMNVCWNGSVCVQIWVVPGCKETLCCATPATGAADDGYRAD